MCLEKKGKKGWWVSKNWDETAVNCILPLISYLQCKKICCQRSCANKYIKLYMGLYIYIHTTGWNRQIQPVGFSGRFQPREVFNTYHFFLVRAKKTRQVCECRERLGKFVNGLGACFGPSAREVRLKTKGNSERVMGEKQPKMQSLKHRLY